MVARSTSTKDSRSFVDFWLATARSIAPRTETASFFRSDRPIIVLYDSRPSTPLPQTMVRCTGYRTTLCRPECDVCMVTVGTRKVSAWNVAALGSDPKPRVLTRISKLPFFRMGDGTEIVGSRSLGIDAEISPYLRMDSRISTRHGGYTLQVESWSYLIKSPRDESAPYESSTFSQSCRGANGSASINLTSLRAEVASFNPSTTSQIEKSVPWLSLGIGSSAQGNNSVSVPYN